MDQRLQFQRVEAAIQVQRFECGFKSASMSVCFGVLYPFEKQSVLSDKKVPAFFGEVFFFHFFPALFRVVYSEHALPRRAGVFKREEQD